MKCPVCSTETTDILLCRKCFFEVPTNDRVKLGNMYLRAPDKPQTYKSKYESVVRQLREKKGIVGPLTIAITHDNKLIAVEDTSENTAKAIEKRRLAALDLKAKAATADTNAVSA